MSDLDIQSDYDSLLSGRYPALFRDAQEQFYRQLFQLRIEDSCEAAAQLDKLDTLNTST